MNANTTNPSFLLGKICKICGGFRTIWDREAMEAPARQLKQFNYTMVLVQSLKNDTFAKLMRQYVEIRSSLESAF